MTSTSNQEKALRQAKYVLIFDCKISGPVESHDVVGAIFGQSEGLLGPELDLRELLRTGRIGRIEVHVKEKGKQTVCQIVVPSNLDRVQTAIIAALVEQVDRVGPFLASISLSKVINVREEKLKLIRDRAKEILREWLIEERTRTDQLLAEVEDVLRTSELIHYGPDKLPAGRGILSSDQLIIVEGRADVLNLLRCGVDNVIALEGAKVSDSLVSLTMSKKEVTAFLDGDHGGDLILQQLIKSGCKIDYVARAPYGREVEELTPREVLHILRTRRPLPEVLTVSPERSVVDIARRLSNELLGTNEAVLLDKSLNILSRIPVIDLRDYLKTHQLDIFAIIMDGIITQNLINIARSRGVKVIVGERIGSIEEPPPIKVLTFSDISAKEKQE
ncbi:DNA primase [archaeon]|nr:DNA primase [archaeon]